MKLATVQRILTIESIDGADKIELATVLGWYVVIKKGEYKVGDLCVYIPIDTIVNTEKQCFSFLSDKKNSNNWVRIKTIKLKGVWSQGLIIPLNSLIVENQNKQIDDFNEDDDVAEILDVRKYEKELVQTPSSFNGNMIPFPKEIIPITDEDNLKSNYKVLDELIGRQIYITKKMDGSSMTIIKKENTFIVCSRRYQVDEENQMYQYVIKDGIKDRLSNLHHPIAIQGEFCGPKINCNQLGLTTFNYYIFTIRDLETGKYYSYDDINSFCQKYKLEPVPQIGGYIDCDESWTINRFQELANEQIYIWSNGKKVPAEGIVVRPVAPTYSKRLDKMLSVKIINQLYKD